MTLRILLEKRGMINKEIERCQERLGKCRLQKDTDYHQQQLDRNIELKLQNESDILDMRIDFGAKMVEMREQHPEITLHHSLKTGETKIWNAPHSKWVLR